MNTVRILFVSGLSLIFLISACKSIPEPPVGGTYDSRSMPSLVAPPEHIALPHRLLLAYADHRAGKEMLPGRVLAWDPDISLGSGLLEQYIEDGAAHNMSDRLRTLVRMRVSYQVPSPFALDINSWFYKDFNITADEIEALRGLRKIEDVASFSPKEQLALRYAAAITATPVHLEQSLLDALRATFSAREIVAIAALSAKVNYWTRLLEALRVKPAGFTDDPALHLQAYDTFGGAANKPQP